MKIAFKANICAGNKNKINNKTQMMSRLKLKTWRDTMKSYTINELKCLPSWKDHKQSSVKKSESKTRLLDIKENTGLMNS